MHKPTRIGKGLSFWIALLLCVSLLPSVQAQQPQQPASRAQKEKSKPQAKKVWTEEDLQVLRTPADEYADQKQTSAQAAESQENTAEKAAPTKKEKEHPALRDEFIPPKTVEEAEERLAQKRDEIRYQAELIERTREEYFNESEDAARQVLSKKIEQLTADLKEAEAHLKLLEASLADVKTKAQPQQRPQQDSGNSQPPAPLL